jgi:internalin A
MKRTLFKSEINVFSEVQEPLKKSFIDPANHHQLLKYFQEVRNKYLYTTNMGLALDDNDMGVTGKPVLLNNLFIPPLLSDKQLTLEDNIETKKERNNQNLQEVYQVLRDHPRLIILGTPGTGKTTLVQWLVLSLTYSGDNHVKGALGNLIPFALILRELPLQGVHTWADLWHVYIKHTGFSINQQLAEALAESGQALFLIDGLDEISDPSSRANLGKVLRDGMNRYNRCRFVTTSRIVGFSTSDLFQIDQEELSSDNNFIHNAIVVDLKPLGNLYLTYLAPFSAFQIRGFVTNWYKQYETNTSIHTERVEDLVTRIEKNDGLGQLSRIPVLLNMICFIHARRTRLPDGRAELYERIAETYLISLDQARGIGFQAKDINVDYQDLSNWLSTIALNMQKNRGTQDNAVLTSRSEIEMVLMQGLEEKGVTEPNSGEQSKFILEYIVNRSGFLVPFGRKDGQEVFAFNHLSFQEYFAARGLNEEISFITNQKEWKKIRKFLAEPHWLETFILLFEIQPSVKKADHLAVSLFGIDCKHLKKSVYQNSILKRDLSPEWLVVAHISMDTAIRLGKDMRRRLIKNSWMIAITSITIKNPDIIFEAFTLQNKDFLRLHLVLEEAFLFHPSFTILSHLLLAEILFHTLFGSSEIMTRLVAGTEKIRLQGKQIRNISCISGLTKLKHLMLTDTGVSDISSLSNLTNLESLSLSHTGVSDISSLSSLVNLRIFWIGQTQVSDISSLSNMTNLESLSLSHTGVSDSSSLSRLTNLKILWLNDTPVSDISSLSRLTNLEFLFMDGTPVSDISSLSRLTNLEILRLNDTPVSDISSLSRLTNLEELSLNNTSVSDISSLSRLTNLEELSLNNTPVSDISSLSRLTNLEELSLNNTPVSDISSLSKLTNLEELSLNDTLVSDISSLSKLTNLKKLSLNNTSVSDISSLSRLTNLNKLSLNNTPVSDISSLSRLTNLEELSLNNTPVSDISSLSRLTNLEELSLNNTPVSDISSLSDQKNLSVFR